MKNIKQENNIIVNNITPIKQEEINLLMNIYKKALDYIIIKLNNLKETINNLYGYDVINTVKGRIKTQKSILKKMKKKNYKMDYESLINNINDIAGVRVICPLKSDVYKIVNIIENMNDIRIIKEKDYIKKSKKSGYSGYHLIVEVPIELEGKEIFVKAEIQLRTMAMDFWATNEHKIKYKSNKKVSRIDSNRLKFYAKILNILDNKMMKISKKQVVKKVNYDNQL